LPTETLTWEGRWQPTMMSIYLMNTFHSLSSSSKCLSPPMFYVHFTLFHLVLSFYLHLCFIFISLSFFFFISEYLSLMSVCSFKFFPPLCFINTFFLSFSSSLFVSPSFPFLFHSHTQFLSLLRKFSLFLLQCFLTTKSHLHQTVSHFVSSSLPGLLISVRLTANSLLSILSHYISKLCKLKLKCTLGRQCFIS
jgi:hypothetical protein